MSGREAGHKADPQTLEVVPGTPRDYIEGWVPELAYEEELHARNR